MAAIYYREPSMLALLNRIEFLFVIFFLMLLFLEIGRRNRLALMKKNPADSGAIGPVETVIFALLGLLLAFTFTGSWSRFEQRRELITREANAIKSMYWRIDLLSPEVQPQMKELLTRYTTIRAGIYRDLSDVSRVHKDYTLGLSLQEKMWSIAVLDCKSERAETYCAALVLPALSEISDIAKTRAMALLNHPPSIIYVMLIILSLFSAFLVGYSLPHGYRRNMIYIVGYAGVISLILYLIFDIEMPRHGLIAVHEADQLILDLKDKILLN